MHVSKRRILVLAVAVATLYAAPARTQDSQYWTYQYGTQAQLLGGAVVGRAVDLSSTYYNPAALMLIRKEIGAVLTTDAFQYRIIKVEDSATGQSRDDLTSTRFSPRPSIFTGLLPSDWLPGQLAYSFLTRADVDLRVDNRVNVTRDVLSPPGDDFFSGEVIFQQDVSDMWYGLTWGDSVDSHVAYGVSAYVTYHGQQTRTQTLAQATPVGGGPGAAVTYVDEFSYWKYGMAFKFGVAIDYTPLTFGLTFTTRRYQLFLGDGKVTLNRSFVGLDLDGDTTPESDIAATFQEQLDPTYKFPMSVAAGTSYNVGNAVIHTSAEYFSRIKRYTVLDAQDVTSENLGITFSPQVFDAREEVLNFAVGLEYQRKRNMAFFSGFRTDFSSHPGQANTNHTISVWNIYHVVAGLSGNIGHPEVTFGTEFSWGSESIGTGLDFEGADEGSGLLGKGREQKVVYRNIGFLIGFSF